MARRSAPGFTIIELLVSMAVISSALALIYSIAVLSSRFYLTGERRAELAQNGRVVLDHLVREFRQTPEVLTAIPETPDDPFFTPPAELTFRNGHQLDPITYIRYWQDPLTGTMGRQVIAYSFSDDPGTYVVYTALDDKGNPPDLNTLEEETVGEFVQTFAVWGFSPLTATVTLSRGDTSLELRTEVLGRNL